MAREDKSAVIVVLVVDDDPLLLELAADVIRRLGYYVLTAENGAEALSLLRRNTRIGVLFSDIRMPGMDGQALAEAARKLRPELRVILTSGSVAPSRRMSFVPKPYRAADLIAALPPQPLG